MATAADIAAVRRATNEPTAEDFSDGLIGDYVDALGSVNAAAAAVWDDKASKYADLVDTIEAGVNHQFSQLHKHASERAEHFRNRAAGNVPSGGGTRVRVIERTDL